MVRQNAAGQRSGWSSGGVGQLQTLVPAFLVFVSLFFVGCGYSPEDPAYDTAANPDDFPPPALTLLNQIDSGELGGYESIANAFGQLYTQHTELLDNTRWKEVVGRLGSKFKFQAVKFRKEGIGSYTLAAEYYLLASFAHPHQTQLAHQAAMFGTWLEADRDPAIDLTPLVASDQTDLRTLIPVIRQFLLSGSLHRGFFQKYVAPTLKVRLEAANRLTAAAWDSLVEIDRGLLAAAGLFSEINFERSVDFETADGQPEIALVAWQIERLDATHYSAEFYCLSRRAIDPEYAIGLRLYVTDSMRPEFSNRAAATAMNMGLLHSITPWKQGEVALVGGDFEFYTTPSFIKVGIFDTGSQPLQFLTLSGQDGDFFELDISALTAD